MQHEIVNAIVAGDVVFDVGANVGDKAQWFIDRGASVVCIEPQPKMAELIRERYSSTPNVFVEERGIGERKGVMKMSICSSTPTLSTLAAHWKTGRFNGVEWDSEIEVEVVTLDELVAKYGTPKYCKIDVEGFELAVISGLTQKIGIVSYEFTAEYISHAMLILEKLIKLGYKEYNVSVGETETFSFRQWIPYYELIHVLMNSAANNKELWGDIYAT